MDDGSAAMTVMTTLRDSDRNEVQTFVQQHWHAPYVCVRDTRYYPHQDEGFVVRHHGNLVGLATFRQEGDALLMITLNSLAPGLGIGSSLVLRVIAEARRRRVRRVWLTTTNDNLKSLGFYQRMGFRLVAVYRDAVTLARRGGLKPEVPEFGLNGLPIHDEIELELLLQPYLDEPTGD